MTACERPLVSVIVPVYNVERYVDCCLDSIRAQTYDQLEIIVVEDCSTDDSLARLKRHVADPRVHLIRHEYNSGLSAARNTGIESATGEYVLFVDSDDAIARNLVQTCVAHAMNTSVDVVVFDFVPFRDGEPLPETGGVGVTSNPRTLQSVEYFRLPHFAWLKFIRRELLDNAQLRFPVGCYYEDWPFHWELGFAAQAVSILEGGWYCYRQRNTSITASLGRKLLDVFRAQEIVLHAIRERDGQAVAHAFSTKMDATFWSVLTRIDVELLPEAVAAAKRLRGGFKRVIPAAPRTRRGAAIAALLSLPSPLASRAIRLVRRIKQVAGASGEGAPT